MLSTKIHPPRQRAALLARPRLLAVLTRTAEPIVLVTGPAGSGKTVLVRQWLDAVDQPTAWLTVDPRDNDPARFWSYFAGALSESFPDLKWPGGGPVTADSLEAMTDRLAEVAPLLLVIDDLHFLVDTDVLAQLGQLIASMPPGVRLVLVSRALPSLQLARHRASAALHEVRGADLLFTDDETRRVLGRATLDPVAAAVQEATGGWPVAVGFAARLPETEPGEAVPARRVARSRQQIADYMTEEILRTQPEAVQDFLLDTSILDDITVPAANAIREANDAAAHLDYLERHDVFLTALDGTDVDTWRHHALVRDHLRRTLERTRPDHWTYLHGAAARYYATRDLERAIGHALTAPDPSLAADMIVRGSAGPSGFDHWAPTAQLLRWLEALPDGIFGERQALRSFGLSIAAMTGRADLIDRWLAGRPPGTTDSLEELFAQAWRADTVGDMPSVRDLCHRALTLCSPGSTWWKAMHGGLAGAEYMLGNWDAAADSFLVLQSPLRDSSSRRAGSDQENVRAFAAVVRARQGSSKAAAAALESLRDWLAEMAGLGYRSEGIGAWAEAMVAYYDGDMATATRWDALPDDSVFGEQPLAPMVLRLDLARVRRLAGDPERAIELLAEVRRRLSAFVDPGLFPEWVAAEEAALGITVPAPNRVLAAAPTPSRLVDPLSTRELEVLRLLRSEFSLPEIASHLFVSYNTAKTHTRMIYRKLDVGSRSAAVSRARALGYL